MSVASSSTSGRFESIGGYCRAKRVGPFVFVAGTTAIEPSGQLHAPNDTYAQSIYVFGIIEESLKQVGAELRHIVRTRAFLSDMSQVSSFVRAHGEVFKDIKPVTSGIEAGLTTPGMMIEIEADAVMHDQNGVIAYEV